jgi:LPXTG-site transpeptidase (sortase) family protein
MPTRRCVITSYLVTTLALIFVSYHLIFTVIGVRNFVYAVQGPKVVVAQKSTDVEHQASDIQPALQVLGFQAEQSLWPTSVSIPSVGIQLNLTGSMEKSGTWIISDTGANFAINTAIPNGLGGNTVLFGHDRPNLFHAIHALKPGDDIYVNVGPKTYQYQMVTSDIVSPTDVSVMDQTDGPTLTLLTCDGWLSQDRYVVKAALVPDASLVLDNHPAY